MRAALERGWRLDRRKSCRSRVDLFLESVDDLQEKPASRLRSTREGRLYRTFFFSVVSAHSVGRLGIGVQCHTCVLAASIYHIEVHVEVWFAAAVQESPFHGRRLDSPQGIHAGVFGTHTATHVLHDQE